MLRGVHTDPWVVLPLTGPEPHMLEIGSKHKHQPYLNGFSTIQTGLKSCNFTGFW